MDHEGAYYKIINVYRQHNYINQYIITSLSTGKTKRVFRHQICEAEISSMFSGLTSFQFDHDEWPSDVDLLMALDATEMTIEPPPKKHRIKDMPYKETIDQLAQAKIEKTTNQSTALGVKLRRGS